MAGARLRSSFIYLANAVHDLDANRRLIALGLGPLVFLASLCLLPDALNLQHSLVRTFEPGVHSVGYLATQVPYGRTPPPAPLFPLWQIRSLHILFLLITAGANLVTICILKEVDSGAGKLAPMAAARVVYREAWHRIASFYWIAFLQLLAIVVGLVLLVVPGVLAFVWLYFAQYALVVDGHRSWSALLYSRELMRGRLAAVAIRIAVFLAVWSGYNSWASAIFIAISLLVGLVGELTGALWIVIFAADLLSVAVAFVTSYFFLAAGYRLYKDLNWFGMDAAREAQMETGPLRGALPPPVEV